ncbi:M23 family metallopeptidase [Bacillus sp. FJAT-42376]|uniref:M23 family metallopeptidase n=1 Tax=Bacillus sp. FJAT-42376 TaxID=2014076 RepID=UPI000F4F06F9|nr:M23 family metallopeptidase [Bacillus sp. FJAT-42376]AZB41104.1 M23 family metallopeptidase [Bacillus sp. FJAT-42376]
MNKPNISKFKYTLACSVMVSSLVFGSHAASAEEQVSTVYHLYIDGKKIGTIDSQDVLKQAEAEAVKRAGSEIQKKGLNLTAGPVEIVPEQMFRPFADNEAAKKELESQLKVEAKAYSIVIGGKTAASFNSKEEAEQSLRAYLTGFIPEEQLKAFEEHQRSGKEFEPIQEGESRITDITYSAPPEIKEQNVKPEEIRNTGQGLDALKNGTKEESLYSVEEGDTFETIARDFGLSADELLKLNGGMDPRLSIKTGDKLKVLVSKPFMEVKVTEESSNVEPIAFEEEKQENGDLPKGEESISQKGEPGEALREYVYTKVNGSVAGKTTVKDEKRKDPVKQIIQIGTKEFSKGEGSLSWPAMGGQITSKKGQRWGRAHKGIDISGVQDRTIKAADNGKVVFAGNSGAYGNKIEIDHQNGMKTVYAHLDSISVSEGETVQKGSKIAVMGSTGRSTGMHLHFEVYKNGNLQNPLDYVKQ